METGYPPPSRCEQTENIASRRTSYAGSKILYLKIVPNYYTPCCSISRYKRRHCDVCQRPKLWQGDIIDMWVIKNFIDKCWLTFYINKWHVSVFPKVPRKSKTLANLFTPFHINLSLEIMQSFPSILILIIRGPLSTSETINFTCLWIKVITPFHVSFVKVFRISSSGFPVVNIPLESNCEKSSIIHAIKFSQFVWKTFLHADSKWEMRW